MFDLFHITELCIGLMMAYNLPVSNRHVSDAVLLPPGRALSNMPPIRYMLPENDTQPWRCLWEGIPLRLDAPTVLDHVLYLVRIGLLHRKIYVSFSSQIFDFQKKSAKVKMEEVNKKKKNRTERPCCKIQNVDQEIVFSLLSDSTKQIDPKTTSPMLKISRHIRNISITFPSKPINGIFLFFFIHFLFLAFFILSPAMANKIWPVVDESRTSAMASRRNIASCTNEVPPEGFWYFVTC